MELKNCVPNLTIDNPRSLEDEARRLAYNDAFEKAKIYANEAGFVSSHIHASNILEERSRQVMSGKMAAQYDNDDSDDVLGRVEITVNLNVDFEIV